MTPLETVQSNATRRHDNETLAEYVIRITDNYLTRESDVEWMRRTGRSGMSHNRSKCERDVRGTQYVGKGYKSKFTCPTCNASCWQHLSFLGSRYVVCNGDKFIKVDRREWDDSMQDELDAAARISHMNPTN